MSRLLRSFFSTRFPSTSVDHDRFAALCQNKKELIDFACRRFEIRSFADLGGVWNVDAGYSFYTLHNYKIDRAVLVDTDFTNIVLKQKADYPALELIEGNFGREDICRQVGQVDVVILFDTLLHQVDPDWDIILEMYAPRTNCFLILNEQFTASDKSIRLLDLPEAQYFENVPHTKNEEPYKSVFEKMYDVHPQHQRIYRDIHNVWQWGITDDDLVSKMKLLNFKMQFYKNAGSFAGLANFETHAFVFTR